MKVFSSILFASAATAVVVVPCATEPVIGGPIVDSCGVCDMYTRKEETNLMFQRLFPNIMKGSLTVAQAADVCAACDLTPIARDELKCCSHRGLDQLALESRCIEYLSGPRVIGTPNCRRQLSGYGYYGDYHY